MHPVGIKSTMAIALTKNAKQRVKNSFRFVSVLEIHTFLRVIQYNLFKAEITFASHAVSFRYCSDKCVNTWSKETGELHAYTKFRDNFINSYETGTSAAKGRVTPIPVQSRRNSDDYSNLAAPWLRYFSLVLFTLSPDVNNTQTRQLSSLQQFEPSFRYRRRRMRPTVCTAAVRGSVLMMDRTGERTGMRAVHPYGRHPATNKYFTWIRNTCRRRRHRRCDRPKARRNAHYRLRSLRPTNKVGYKP